MKKLLIITISLVLLFVIGYLFLKSKKSPVYNGSVVLENTVDSTEVLFDEFGVPHIYSENGEDAYRALGYVHAMERIFQMEMMRRAGSGTLAELLGEELIDADKFFRTLGIPAHAKLSAATFLANDSFPGRNLVFAYLEGINNFIEKGNLPLEYTLLGSDVKPFTIEDVFASIGYMAFTFAPQLTTDPLLTKIHRQWGVGYLQVLSVNTFPEHVKMPVHYPAVSTNANTYANSIAGLFKSLPVPAFMGSNSWVIAPSKTASGKVVFANDTHIGFSSPSVWYEAHIEYPGFSYYGNFLAGIPFPLVGHSRTSAIGLTMFLNDDLDLYEEKIDTLHSSFYVFKDTLLPLKIVEDTIQVKGKEQVLFTVTSTHHGPVMNEVLPELQSITNNPVASWWVYLQEPSKALEALYKLIHATKPSEAAEGARLIHAPGLNVMYGDASGNIAWWASAKLPVRPPHVEGKFFLQGWTGNDEILGWYPFEENPMSVNPPEGYVISANNQPDTMAAGVLYPGYYYPGDRYYRIAKALKAENDFTIEKLKAVQTESINETQAKIAQELLSHTRKNEFENYVEVLNKLANWQGTHQLNEASPVLYYKWLFHVLKLMMEDELGEEAFHAFLDTHLKARSLYRMIVTGESPWWDNKHTPQVETPTDIINEALKIAIEELEDELGKPSKWKWKKAVVSVHRHPLGAKKPLDRIFNVTTSPVEANAEAVNKLAFVLNGEGKYEVKSGPAMRILLDFNDIENSLSILPTGQSGNVFSKHYTDQAEMFVNYQYRKQMMNEEEIRSTAKARLLFLRE